MHRLQQLVNRCKCSVFITVNQHRDWYETAEEYLVNTLSQGEIDELAPGVFEEMVKRDTIVEIRWYPDTPTSFCRVVHYDLEMALSLVEWE